MEPTPDALRLAAEIDRALTILHNGVAAFTGAIELDPLVLSVGGYVGRRWLPPRLSRLVAGPAGAGLEIRVEDRHADLAGERVDVGIRYGTGDWDGLHCHRLLTERTFPVCSPELAASHDMRGPADLLNHRLLHRDNRPWNLWFARFGLEPPPRTGPVFDDSLLMVEGAAQGLGLALVVDGMVDEELRTGRLVRPLPEQFVSDLDMYMVWLPSSRKLPRIHALRDWLLAEIAADQPANRAPAAAIQVA
jgi:LysR family glycine cleavage system transcriptional activator